MQNKINGHELLVNMKRLKKTSENLKNEPFQDDTEQIKKNHPEIFYEIIMNSPDSTCRITRDGKILFCNFLPPDQKYKDTGNLTIFDIIPDNFKDEVQSALNTVFNDLNTTEFIFTREKTDKSIIWYKSRISPVIIDKKPVTAIITEREITEYKILEEDLRRQSFVVEQMFDGVIVTDLKNLISDFNPASERIFGHKKEDLLGQEITILYSPDKSQITLHNILEGIRLNNHWTGEIEYVRKDGTSSICETIIVPYRDAQGKIIATISVNRDISRRREYEDRIRFLASHDPLTNIPNRQLFIDRLTMAIKTSHRKGTKTAVMFIDLDGFKSVNDTMGHDAGDVVLQKTAARLSECIRESDTVGRFGGDEFTVILTEITKRGTVSQIARRMIELISEPFDYMDMKANIGCSIGISIYPDNSEDPRELIMLADNAMYQVKNSGKKFFRFFL